MEISRLRSTSPRCAGSAPISVRGAARSVRPACARCGATPRSASPSCSRPAMPMLELAQAPRSAAHVLQQRAPERWLGALAGKLLELSYRVSGKARYDDYRLERVLGTPLLVTPSVFNPKIPRSGAFLASRIATLRLPAGVDVLDMGTGSGVCALVAARSVRRVVAVDINAAAVRCAQLNALLNRLEHRVDVRHGDLYEPLTGERFDLV